MKSLAQLKIKLLKNPQTRAEYGALAGEFEAAPSYEEAVKSQIHPVDWAWANESLTLPIFAAVGLSLGYEINTLAPVDQAWKKRPFVQPPEEYKRRVATTYEAVRIGILSCLTTNKIGSTFDVTARFSDAQFWEVSTVEFRRFCDDRDWQVPADFLPNGYAPTDPAPAQAAALPATGANSASSAPGNGKLWTEERKAEARAYRNIHGLKKTAEHYGVSETTISKHIPAGLGKKKMRSPWAGLDN